MVCVEVNGLRSMCPDNVASKGPHMWWVELSLGADSLVDMVLLDYLFQDEEDSLGPQLVNIIHCSDVSSAEREGQLIDIDIKIMCAISLFPTCHHGHCLLYSEQY